MQPVKPTKFVVLKMNRFENHTICKICVKLSDVMINHRAMTYLPALIEDCGSYLKKENLFRIVHEYLHLNYSKFKVLNGKKVNRIVSKYYIYFIRHRHLIHSIPSPAFSPLRRKEVSKEYRKHLSFVIEMYQNYHVNK